MNNPFERPFNRPPASAADRLSVSPAPARDGASADWGSPTELATQLYAMPTEGEQGETEIGKNVGNHVRELFVVCEPGEALRQQFDKLARVHMAVHGLGNVSASKLLAAIAQTAGWPLKRLVVRRQGFGNSLAELQYIDCPAHDNKLLRVYATDVEADAAARASVSRLLLGRARMVAVMLDEQPERAMQASLQGLHGELLAVGGSRHVVLLPLARSDALRMAIDEFKRRNLAQSEVFPATRQPAQQWALLATAWNRLYQAPGQAGAHPGYPGLPAEGAVLLRQINIGAKQQGRPIAVGTPAPTATSAASAVRASQAGPAGTTVGTTAGTATAARPPAAAAASAPAPAVSATAPPEDPMRRYAAELQALPGVRGGAVFELNTLRVLSTLPSDIPADKLAMQGRTLVMAAAQAGPVLGLGAAIGELLLSLGDVQLMLRPVPRHAGVVLHLVVDRHADLAALRQGIKRADLALA